MVDLGTIKPEMLRLPTESGAVSTQAFSLKSVQGAGPSHLPLAQLEPAASAMAAKVQHETFLSLQEPWTAPPSPQTLLAELALPPPKKEKAQAKLRPYDVEEARDECLTALLPFM